MIESIEGQLFNEEVKQIDYELPANFTKEIYIQIVSKLLAVVRYKFYPPA